MAAPNVPTPVADKVHPLDEAVGAIETGASVAVGGMHAHNNPMALVREAIRQGVRVGTLYTSPSASVNADLWIGADLVDAVFCAYVGLEDLGLAPNFRAWTERGRLRVREADEAAVVYGLRAGASTLPFLPLPEGVGETDIPARNPEDYRETTDPYTGRKVLCVRAIRPDVALIHAQKADAAGNCIFEGSPFTDVDMAFAARRVIVQCEELVTADYIREHADRVRVPGLLVHSVVPVPLGCHPTSSHRYYRRDEEHLRRYIAMCTDNPATYLEKYVYGAKTNEDYLEAIGGREHIRGLLEREVPY